MARKQQRIDAVGVLNYKADGIPYIPGSSGGGLSFQHGKVTQAGATPFAVNLADITLASSDPARGLAEMADTEYFVLGIRPDGTVIGDVAAERTTTAISLAGGADTEVLRVLVIGRLKDQAHD